MSTQEQAPTEEVVMDALRYVEDPELGMDIVEIGLVYGIEFPVSGTVQINYSLTTPACPAGAQIKSDIIDAVRVLPGVEEVRTELVWMPAWTPDLMSDDAKFILGIG